MKMKLDTPNDLEYKDEMTIKNGQTQVKPGLN